MRSLQSYTVLELTEDVTVNAYPAPHHFKKGKRFYYFNNGARNGLFQFNGMNTRWQCDWGSPTGQALQPFLYPQEKGATPDEVCTMFPCVPKQLRVLMERGKVHTYDVVDVYRENRT